MPVDGRFRDYYWKLRTFLATKAAILDEEHDEYLFPKDDDSAYYTHHLEGCLIFIDGTRLIFEFQLALGENYEVIEQTYFYGYYDQQGERVFQYDNAPHHPNLETHPHHIHKGPRPREGKDEAFDTDLTKVNFIAIVSKIERMYFQDTDGK